MVSETTWKIWAISVTVILITLVAVLALGMYLNNKEQKQNDLCLYSFCAAEPAAQVVNGVCYCQDYDVLGQLQVTKERPLRMLE